MSESQDKERFDDEVFAKIDRLRVGESLKISFVNNVVAWEEIIAWFDGSFVEPAQVEDEENSSSLSVVHFRKGQRYFCAVEEKGEIVVNRTM